ncbi:MAG TPA: cation diffusion facilitator family transporter [Candidatus Dormibacteraeota bacterium]|nr:cation diffusion facilitator family transporter [Candidatus Dormibacteraeota bacterium]
MSGGHAHSHGAYDDRDAVRAVIISAIVLGIAAAIEFAAAIASSSAGVLADALHNAGDVLTTFILLFAFALARRPATRRFPSGYGRIEDIATLLIVVVIVVTALVAGVESIRRLIQPETYHNIPLSLFAAAVGVVANLSVSEFKVRVGRSVGSTALEADGVHSRADALVSAGAFVGIGLAGLGLRLADPIAGLVITAAIVYILGGTLRQLVLRMMDAVDPKLIDELAAAAGGVPGVLGVHDVRARWVGRELIAVMHVDCAADASLKEAHALAERVEHEVAHAVPEARVDIHMDPGVEAHEHARRHEH